MTSEYLRAQVFELAAKHCDQAIGNRERAVQGWNFSKDGLLAFVRAARELSATPEEADRERWEAHIRMERQAMDAWTNASNMNKEESHHEQGSRAI